MNLWECYNYLQVQFISLQYIGILIHTTCLIANVWQYQYRMSRIPLCCCASMLSCPATNMLLPALMVKNVDLITNCGKFGGNMITLTQRGMTEFDKEKIHSCQKNIGKLDMFIAMCILSRSVTNDAFICSYSTHCQIRVAVGLAVTHLRWLVTLCHRLVQKARSCLDLQGKQHGKYREYPSRYCNNV